MKIRISVITVAVILASSAASAVVCVNKYVSRKERQMHVVTFLTGKLTFQEAQALAKSIQAKQVKPLEWVDESGKLVSRQFGELKVVRPMPVGCDGKSSGVVMIASFPAMVSTQRKFLLRLDEETTITFEQQTQ